MNSAATEIPEHLGGFLSGPVGDPATYFPHLWLWFMDKLDVASVLDIGCGEGHAARFFHEMGRDVLGIDGVENEEDWLCTWDFTEGPLESTGQGFDLGWCCEFLEHIEERFLPNLNSTFQACDMLAVTHAFPGQLGHHHVNCRDQSYWLGYFAGIGFTYDAGLTQRARAVAGFNRHEYNHFLRSGMVLRKNP